jgi:hypothetical protein
MVHVHMALQQLALLLVLAALCCTAAASAGTASATRQLRTDFGITESYYSDPAAAAAQAYGIHQSSSDAAAAAVMLPSFQPIRRILDEAAAPAPGPAVPPQPQPLQPTASDDISLLAVPISSDNAAAKGAQNVQLRWPPYDYIQHQLKQLDGTEDQQQQASKKFSVVIMNWSRPENTKRIAETYTTDPAYEPYVAEVVVLHLKSDAFFELPNPKVNVCHNSLITESMMSSGVGCLACMGSSAADVMEPWVRVAGSIYHLCWAGDLPMCCKKCVDVGQNGTLGCWCSTTH